MFVSFLLAAASSIGKKPEDVGRLGHRLSAKMQRVFTLLNSARFLLWVPSSVSWWYHYVGGRMKQETVVRVRWTAAQTWQPLSFRHPHYPLRRPSIQVFLGLWTPNKSFASVLETLPVKLRVHMCNLCSWVCRVNTVESWLGAEGFAVSSRSFFNYPFPPGSLHDLFLVPLASVVLFFFSSHFLLPSWGMLWVTVG